MGVNDKMGVRGVGKEARVHGQRRPISGGKIAAYKSPQDGLIFRMAVTVHRRWIIDRLLQMMPARTLEAGDTIDGKAVERAFLDRHVEHREGTHLKMRGTRGCIQIITWRSGCSVPLYCVTSRCVQAPAVSTRRCA